MMEKSPTFNPTQLEEIASLPRSPNTNWFERSLQTKVQLIRDILRPRQYLTTDTHLPLHQIDAIHHQQVVDNNIPQTM